MYHLTKKLLEKVGEKFRIGDVDPEKLDSIEITTCHMREEVYEYINTRELKNPEYISRFGIDDVDNAVRDCISFMCGNGRYTN